MKVLGIVAEYNPFHNGHLYHLEQSKKICNADYVICVMSGNFIQRGEPAIFDKWTRTHMAISNGIDLVIELPFIYSASSAEYFAFAAVKILDSLGIVDYISFGSESGDIDKLKKISSILENEPNEYKTFLKQELKTGISFPKARQNAILKYITLKNYDVNLSNILSTSNNILAIEYLKALERLKSPIIPITISRVSNDYNTKILTGNISSATAIRETIINQTANLAKNLSMVLPSKSLDLIIHNLKQNKGPIISNDFEKIILWYLRKASVETIKNINYVSEGLENRLKKFSIISKSYDELIFHVLTKRYTKTRIQRALINCLVELKKEQFDTFIENGFVQYIRILGFNKKNVILLSKIKSSSALPLIVKPSDFKNSKNKLIKNMIEIESIATDVYVLAFNNKNYRLGGQEFTQSIIKLP